MKNTDNENIKNPFKVPDNYFEEVNRKILAQTTGIQDNTIKINGYNRFRRSLLIAASVIGFILLGYSTVKLFIHEKEKTTVSEFINESNKENYINDIDISALEESVSLPSNSVTVPDVSGEDIIDYLLSENIEITEIYAKL